jgi:Tol biopolymer transport system component
MLRLHIRRFPKSLFVLAASVSLITIIPHVLSAKRIKGDNFHVTGVSQITHDGMTKTKLLTNGFDLYVVETQAGQLRITKMSGKGPKTSSISTPFPSFQVLDVSSDGTKLMLSSNGKLPKESEFWSLYTDTGSVERLGSVVGRDGAWSSDQRTMVFSRDTDLYIANADGTGPRKIYSAAGSLFAPRFSPDTRRIRFTVHNAAHNTNSIWEVSKDGVDPRPVLPGWSLESDVCCGKWTNNGRYYIFQKTSSNITTLWGIEDSTLQQKDSKAFELTDGPVSFSNAAVAADAKNIWAIGVQPAGEVVTYDPQSKKFTSLLPGESATDLDFSTDGNWVAYVTVPEGTLWKSHPDGTGRVQLTRSPEKAALPRWSPDGSHIAYVSAQIGQPWAVAVISNDGGPSKRVNNESRDQVDANWSPDGTRMMYGYVRDLADISIHVVDLRTHSDTQLPGSEGLFSPRWSPDGRYVAALSKDLTKLMLFDYDSGKWTTWLTEPAGAVNYPVWSADSKSIYFDDLITDEESIRRVKIGETRAERVFVLVGLDRYPGPFGLWSGRKADGSWMFVRDSSTEEIYRLRVQLRRN